MKVKSVAKTPTLGPEDGLIIGYRLDRPEFKHVFMSGGCENTAWKHPVFVLAFANNPAPLLLKERWFYDKRAFDLSLRSLPKRYKEKASRTRALFESSSRFVPIDIQDLLTYEGAIDIILDTMSMRCNSKEFKEGVAHIVESYGDYAAPDAITFEKLNCGVMRALALEYDIFPLEDVLRAPLYQAVQLDIARSEDYIAAQASIAAQAAMHIVPIPYIGNDWTIESFRTVLESKAAADLREVVRKTLNGSYNGAIPRFTRNSEVGTSNVDLFDVSVAFVAATAGAVATAIMPLGAAFWAAAVGTAALTANFGKKGFQYSSRQKATWIDVAVLVNRWIEAEAHPHLHPDYYRTEFIASG